MESSSFTNAMNTPPGAKTARSRHHSLIFLTALSMVLAVIVTLITRFLIHLINYVTNVSFYGHFTSHVPGGRTFISPAHNHLGLFVIAIPTIGGVIVGLMARYGSKAIRGHGIPEAMEQILENRSKIPARITVLKPLSAAVSIGTGGPFGAEGPIIATGGALGSLFGQILSTTSAERKILLTAGAAAGMTAIFGSPVAAVLLSIELLLFEFRARSLIPVALACAVAAVLRIWIEGSYQPIFAMTGGIPLTAPAMIAYILFGVVMGFFAVGVTQAIYFVEDMFERLPVHWMWWPAIGGVAVGVIGYFSPLTMGVGYDNIRNILGNHFSIKVVAILCGMKLISWVIALGSGTSGGTLAPILTVGGGVGALCGYFVQAVAPAAGVDIGMMALVGMAAIFAGASRALLTSVVFAYETTLAPDALAPLLAGATAAYLVSHLIMRDTIMTERITRRGLVVPDSYEADTFRHTTVARVMTPNPRTIPATMAVSELVKLIEDRDPSVIGHQATLITSDEGALAGIITRGDLFRAVQDDHGKEQTVLEAGTSSLTVTYPDEILSEAVMKMLQSNIGRLPVVDRENPKRIVGYVGRTNILSARMRGLYEETVREPGWLANRSNTKSADKEDRG